jgi:hypothetical protein
MKLDKSKTELAINELATEVKKKRSKKVSEKTGSENKDSFDINSKKEV